MKKIVLIFLLLTCSIGIGKAWHTAKGGFNIQRICGWPLPEKYPLTDEALRALGQDFRFLGRGRQCYAFASEDGQYVLKLPRTDRYRPPFWSSFFPKQRVYLIKDVDYREKFMLESFRLAYEELADHTAVLALRMGSGEGEEKTVQIADKLGRKYKIDLRKTPFVLQKKFPVLIPCFEKALAQGNKEEAKLILDCFVDAVHARAKKGILNKDPSFIKNFGFDGKKAYQIDIGSFYRIEKLGGYMAVRKAMNDTIGPVRIWLAGKDKELANHLDEKIEEVLQKA